MFVMEFVAENPPFPRPPATSPHRRRPAAPARRRVSTGMGPPRSGRAPNGGSRSRQPRRADARRPSLLSGCLPFLAVALAPGCGPDPPAFPALESLEIAGPAGLKTLVPAFAPDLRHYAVRCAERESLSVAASTRNDGEPTTLTLNGAPLPGGRAEVSLRHDQDLAVEVRRGAESTTYAIHCVPLDFPEVTVVTRPPGPAEGLLLVDFYYDSAAGGRVSYIAILDDHGVPRFHRRAAKRRASNLRWHARHRLYSYASVGPEESSCSDTDAEMVLLDERLEVVDRVRAVGLCNTDRHDFLITPEGNYLFIAYIPAERDFSAVPGPDGEYPYSTTEATHDSVIQEVTPEGEVVFQWNSGEARTDGTGPPLKMADCRVHRFPDHYAWLNSFSLTAEGHLLASFRGCAQVLEIDRPSGQVRRQLGGSAPAIPDGRVHYRFVGDPVPAGFCGQHTPIQTGDDRIALFDNGVHCLEDRNEDWRQPHENHRSRVVEYRLSGGEAVFLRHHEVPFPVNIAGSVQTLAGGNWLIAQGWNPGLPLLDRIFDRIRKGFETGVRWRRTSVVEVDPAGREVFAMWVRGEEQRARIYRAYREPGLTIPLNLP